MDSREGNGALESFLSVFLWLRKRLSRSVGRIVPPDDVEDILQETFLRCYQASARTTVQFPRSFMLTTARNLALNHIALAQNRLVESVDSFDDSAVALYREEPTQDSLETEERFLMLCRAVRVLPAQCRRAFVLMKVYGLSRKEVASYMGISENTVHKHVTKGLMMCAEYLEESESESPAKSRGTDRLTPAAQKQRSSR
jgi:RNA polymerase sigma factor (sigma-70 family)